MKGYKAFNKDNTNKYGMIFEEGKTYTVDGKLEYEENDMDAYSVDYHKILVKEK